MVASGSQTEWTNGHIGQIENISLPSALVGHEYTGRVHYFSGSANAPFSLVVAGTNNAGVLGVYFQEDVSDFIMTPEGNRPADYTYSYLYTDPN